MSKITPEVFRDQIHRKATDIGSFVGSLLALPLIYFFVKKPNGTQEYLFLLSFGIYWLCGFLGWLIGLIIGMRILSRSQFEILKKN